MQLTVDLSGVRPDARHQFVKDVVHEDKARYALGLIEQRKLKQHADAIGKAKFAGEFRPQVVMSADQWKRTMNQYGELCMSDPDFMPWFLKKDENRDLRVKDPGSKIMVGWRGVPSCQNPKPETPNPKLIHA